MSFLEVSHVKVFNEAIRVTMSRAMYSFSQFFALGFWGVLMRHMHFARSVQGGVLGNLEFHNRMWAHLDLWKDSILSLRGF